MTAGKSGYFDIAGNRTFTIRVHWAEEYDIATNTSFLSITNIQAKSTLFNGVWFPKGTISVEGTAIRTMDYAGKATHAVPVYANETWGDLYPPNPDVHGEDAFPWSAGEFVHATDGTKNVTFSVNLQLWRDSSTGVVTFSGSNVVSLTTIPRLSSLSASNGTLGSAQTLTVTQQSSSFTHTIKYSCGNASGTIPSNGSDTSISWTPPISLAAQNATGSSVPVTLTIETFSGSTLIGTNSISITCAIPASVAPSVSIETSDPTGNFTKFGGYVQNKSTCKVKLTASGSQGSTIKSYSIAMGNTSYSDDSATFDLPTSGSKTIKVKVTDSRGRTAEATATINVLAYSNPTVSASAYRSDSSGNANKTGEYMAVKFTAAITALSSKNSYSYTVQHRLKGATAWTNATPTASGYSPTNNVTVIAADPTKSYEARVVVADDFSSATSAVSAVLSAYAFVDLDKGNNRIGFGKRAEGSNVLDVAWNLRVRGDATLDGKLTVPSLTVNATSAFPIINLRGTGGNSGYVYIATETGHIVFRNIDNDTGFYENYQLPATTNLSKNAAYSLLTSKSPVTVAQGGTGGTTADTARTNLGYDYTVIKDFGRLGLSGAVTTKQVFDAMPKYSICVVTSSNAGTDYISDAPTSSCLVELIKANMFGMGKASSIGSSTATHYVSTYHSGSGFTGWDCLNPQFQLGTEYATAEIHRGKRVYSKVVDCGTVTNGTVYTYHTSTVYPIRYAAYTSAGIALPLFMEVALNSTYKAWVDVNTNKITARFNTGYSSLRIYCQIWYTKT